MDLTTLRKLLPSHSCDFSLDEETADMLSFGIRTSAGDDEPSNETRKAANMLLNFVKTNYPDIKREYEFCDEWINLTFTNKV